MLHHRGARSLCVLEALAFLYGCAVDDPLGPSNQRLPLGSAAGTIALPALVESTPCPPAVPPGYALVTCFDFNTIPGVWHGFTLGSSKPPASSGEVGQLSAEYLLLSPSGLSRLVPGSIVDVNTATYAFESEFNGVSWNDVLRIVTPAGEPPQDVTIAVVKRPVVPIESVPCSPEAPSGYTLLTCFEFTTMPGVWHGFLLASSLPPDINWGQRGTQRRVLTVVSYGPFAVALKRRR